MQNSKSVISLFNERKNDILCVCGNCDGEVDQMVLNFPIMADYAIIEMGNNIIFVTHGLIYNENILPPLKDGDILLNGHTHIPANVKHENYTYLNPGSVSIPKENSHHGYMIYENGNCIWKDLDGYIIKL